MRESSDAFDALAAASSAMLAEHHVADVLARLVSDCLAPLPAEAAAVLAVRNDRSSLTETARRVVGEQHA